MSKEKSQSNEDEKVKHIIRFITEHQNDFTRCADAHRAYMAEHGKVSYVHFNRKFRELCPHLKEKSKVRTLKPYVAIIEPTPKNQELKNKKRCLQHFHKLLRDSEALLQEALDAKADKEQIDYYRDIRDRDRKAIVDCYEELLAYYEEKISDDIKEIDEQLRIEDVRRGEEIDRMLSTRANVLIDESDEVESEEEEAALEDSVSSTFKSAAHIMSKETKTKKIEIDLEPEPSDYADEEMQS